MSCTKWTVLDQSGRSFFGFNNRQNVLLNAFLYITNLSYAHGEFCFKNPPCKSKYRPLEQSKVELARNKVEMEICSPDYFAKKAK